MKTKNRNLKFVMRAAAFAALTFAGQGYCEETSLPFLKMNVGAHSQSMAGAYMAKVQDGSANASNPSAIVNSDRHNLFIYHSEFISGSKYNYMGYAHPFESRKAGMGVAVAYFTKGDFQGRDADGNATGDFNASDALVTLSYSRRIGASFSWGLAANYIRSNIESVTGSGFALDFAGSYQISARTNAALGVFHMGPKFSYTKESHNLPSQVGAGIAHRLFGPLTLTSDARYGLNDRNFSIAVGGEMDVAQVAALRAGYNSQISQKYARNSENNFNNLSGLGMGMGLRLFSRAALDYAFVPMGELGGTHHADLSWRF